MADPVQVVGLREFTRELRKLDSTFPKAVRQANKEIADRVASESRSAAESQGGVAAKTAPSIKALAQQAKAQVSVGGTRYPFAMGALFGSIQYKQFPAWKGSAGDAGYFLFPQLRSMRREITDTYGQALARVTRAAFPD